MEECQSNDILIWETVKYAPKTVRGIRQIIIRVYAGAKANPQSEAFVAAWSDNKTMLSSFIHPNVFGEPEIMGIAEMTARHWTIEDLITWLLGADIHFILGHVHQGHKSHSSDGCYLDMLHVKDQLKRLYHHTGFPYQNNLLCPVFTQDKIEYLKALGIGEMANHTIAITLVSDGAYDDETLSDLHRFCEQHTEGIGYVLKAPFTTNSQYIHFCSSTEDVIAALMRASDDFGRIPYVMIQPKMYNRREHKVICWDGEPRFVCSFSNSGNSMSVGGVNHSFSATPHSVLFDFVRKAIAKAKLNCPQLMTDGLFRVDVFQRKDGTLVVNEFESLEANFPSSKADMENKTRRFMSLYLGSKIIDSVKQFVHSL